MTRIQKDSMSLILKAWFEDEKEYDFEMMRNGITVFKYQKVK